MSRGSDGNASREPPALQPDRSTLQWLLYCGGVCLELLGIAFTGAVVVAFLGRVETRVLLGLTVLGMTLFYSGWWCVRHASQRPSMPQRERR